MGDFRKLTVFERAHSLALETYAATRSFPAEEQFGLVSQTRRAAASIGANLAEGSGRDSDRELARFVRIALGSASELEYHLLLARDLGYLHQETWATLAARCDEIRRMLASLARRLTSPALRPDRPGTGSLPTDGLTTEDWQLPVEGTGD